MSDINPIFTLAAPVKVSGSKALKTIKVVISFTPTWDNGKEFGIEGGRTFYTNGKERTLKGGKMTIKGSWTWGQTLGFDTASGGNGSQVNAAKAKYVVVRGKFAVGSGQKFMKLEIKDQNGKNHELWIMHPNKSMIKLKWDKKAKAFVAKKPASIKKIDKMQFVGNMKAAKLEFDSVELAK